MLILFSAYYLCIILIAFCIYSSESKKNNKSDLKEKLSAHCSFKKKNSCQTYTTKPANYISSHPSQLKQKVSEKSLHKNSKNSLSNFDLRHSKHDKKQFEFITKSHKTDNLRPLKLKNSSLKPPSSKLNISVSKLSLEKLKQRLK